MKARIIAVLAAMAMASASSFGANLASDNAADPAYSGGFTNGSNGGSGFSAWTITSDPGGGFAGAFIGNPADAGITGMSSNSFGLFANPNSSGAFVNADRSTTGGGLSVGQTLTFEWSINFDSNADGNKGFNLYVGGVGGTQIVNINNANTSAITLNGTDIGFGYGVNAMTWTFTAVDATTLAISANDRDGTGTFSTNLTVSSSSVDTFRFYASQMQSGDQAQPYFNNLAIVPEPSTIVLGLVGALGVIAARRRMQK